MTPSQFKQHRKSLNLTQSQLADKLGLSPKYGDDYIRMLEKGNRKPSGVLIRCFEFVIKEQILSTSWSKIWDVSPKNPLQDTLEEIKQKVAETTKIKDFLCSIKNK